MKGDGVVEVSLLIRQPSTRISSNDGAQVIFDTNHRLLLSSLLMPYLVRQRWFASKSRSINSTCIYDVLEVVDRSDQSFLVLVLVQYTQGADECYLLSLACLEGNKADTVLAEHSNSVVARLLLQQDEQIPVVLCDPLSSASFSNGLLNLMAGEQFAVGEKGRLVAYATSSLKAVARSAARLLPSLISGEQSNSSINIGDKLMIKLFRKLQATMNPDVEIGKYLSTEAKFSSTPHLMGTLAFQGDGHEAITVAFAQEYVPNKGNAWDYTLKLVEDYFKMAVSYPDVEIPLVSLTAKAILESEKTISKEPYGSLLCTSMGSARLLGRRTAELHLALASGQLPDFVPETFSLSYQHTLYQAAHDLMEATFRHLHVLTPSLPCDIHEQAVRVLPLEEKLEARFSRLLDKELQAVRIRIHGDYHLGQVLYTGSDYVIIDFEGEPLRSIRERRMKYSPLRDVVSMIRSYQNAAYRSYFSLISHSSLSKKETMRLKHWTDIWAFWVSVTFFNAYQETASEATLLPSLNSELELLFDVMILEKIVYGLAYEMNNRPAWLKLPLTALLQQVNE